LRLGCWGEPESFLERQACERRDALRRAEHAKFQAAENAKRSARLEARDELHNLLRLQRNTEQQMAELRNKPTPEAADELETLIEVASLLVDQIREVDAEYAALAGLERSA
jgi:hypothetical protein